MSYLPVLHLLCYLPHLLTLDGNATEQHVKRNQDFKIIKSLSAGKREFALIEDPSCPAPEGIN